MHFVIRCALVAFTFWSRVVMLIMRNILRHNVYEKFHHLGP
jgi:hypothetical protein